MSPNATAAARPSETAKKPKTSPSCIARQQQKLARYYPKNPRLIQPPRFSFFRALSPPSHTKKPITPPIMAPVQPFPRTAPDKAPAAATSTFSILSTGAGVLVCGIVFMCKLYAIFRFYGAKPEIYSASALICSSDNLAAMAFISALWRAPDAYSRKADAAYSAYCPEIRG